MLLKKKLPYNPALSLVSFKTGFGVDDMVGKYRPPKQYYSVVDIRLPYLALSKILIRNH